MKNKLLICSIVLISTSLSTLAAGFDEIKPADPFSGKPTTQSNIEINVPKKATLTKNDVHNHYAIAQERFVQSNVKSSYMDFRMLIETVNPNDYAYMLMVGKMADLGFFTLANLSASKITDEDLSYVYVEDIKKFYYPSVMLKPKDEIYLAEIFSNIIYNAQSKEATAELLKNEELLKTSDYANYLAALGLLKSGNGEVATKYIDAAIEKNPQNINYKKLKAEIALQNGKNGTALKLISEIKQAPLQTKEFKNKVNSLEEYILYKTAKQDYLKKYHLAYYYYYEGELTKAARTLQNAGSNKKSHNKVIYALLSRVYFDSKEFEKAESFAQKANNLDGSNPIALMVLGDVSTRKNDLKTAVKYYKKASSCDKKSPDALVKLAETYRAMNKPNNADEIYEKILKERSDCPMAYYNVAMKDLSRKSEYLKKSVALDISFEDAWLELAKTSLDKNMFDNAKKYLKIAKYIDENNFKYYYYQGLFCKSQGLAQEAAFNFKKSLTLKPDFQPAKEELSI